jgi:RNA 3'-terminal phosphate cyclase (ATP)
MISIDGSQGEGGGQVLRTALALSLVTGKPFSISNIRARRKKSGLMRQHLTAVRAATEVGRAKVTGASLRSSELTFEPTEIRSGDFHFAVGTAGSATLVLQTVLPALILADGSSALRLEGGTHNPWAPPFDFLDKTFLPLLSRMGPTVNATLDRPGFYPAGGGEFHVTITPTNKLAPLLLLERGETERVTATARVSHLPLSIAERELRVVGEKLGLSGDNLIAEKVTGSHGPGNIVTIEVQSEHVTEVFTGFGERQVAAEKVAKKPAEEARRYLSKGVAVGEHLTDQLLIPLGLAGGGAFRTLGLSQHAQTNVEVIKAFFGVSFQIDRDTAPGCVVTAKPAEST